VERGWTGNIVTRLWRTGSPITVQCHAGWQPAAFTWQGQQHQVGTLLHQWRVDIDWWRERVWRNYYKLTTETGLLVIIYQDMITKEWYLQRLYD